MMVLAKRGPDCGGVGTWLWEVLARSDPGRDERLGRLGDFRKGYRQRGSRAVTCPLCQLQFL